MSFEGSVKNGSLSVTVLPNPKLTSARILITMRAKVNPMTLSSALSGSGGPSYGDADAAAGFVATYRGIIAVLSDIRYITKYGYIAAHIHSTGRSVNMVFDFGGRESKVFGALKTIMTKLAPKRAEYASIISRMTDCSGKFLKSTADGFHNAEWAVSEGRNGVDVLISGKVIVNTSKSGGSSKTKVAKKVAAAAEALDRHERCPKVAAPPHDDCPEPKFTATFVAAKTGMDFARFDFLRSRNKATAFGGGYLQSGDMGLSADQVKSLGNILETRFKEYAGPLYVYLASGCGIFDADELGKLGNITAKDIARAM